MLARSRAGATSSSMWRYVDGKEGLGRQHCLLLMAKGALLPAVEHTLAPDSTEC